MATYFNNFPKIQYSFRPNSTIKIPATNIVSRFKPLDEVLARVDIYYQYEVKDGERPEIVAHKIYGKSDYDWIILLFNQRIDPYFQWYMGNNEFNDFINEKYGSISYATQNVHHYEWIVQPSQILFDGTSIPEKTLVVDHDTYLTLVDDERRAVYYFDYEFAINEQNRQIKIVDSVYIPQILREKERIFG